MNSPPSFGGEFIRIRRGLRMRLIIRGNKVRNHSGYFSEIISNTYITFYFIEIFFPFVVSVH